MICMNVMSNHIAFVLPNLAGGGAERIALTLAHGLQRQGHHVHIFLLGNLIQHAIPEGIQLHVLSETGRVSRWKWRNHKALAKILKQQMGCMHHRPFDLVVSHLLDADRVVRAADLPNTWFCIHNTLSVPLAKMKPSKRQRRLKRYHRTYDGQQLICVSHGSADDLQQQLQLHPKCIEVIYNPFDLDTIRHKATQSCPDLPTQPYCIHVGRFCTQKRHDRLLAAFAQAQTSHHLVCLCEPDDRLAALIAQYGLQDRVHVTGFQTNPYPWIEQADLLILTSDHEGLPSVLIESLICGTPVVSTDCPSGPREILGEALQQWLVPVDDVKALAQTIDDALHSEIALPEMQKFAVETAVQHYLALIEKSDTDEQWLH